MSSKKSFRIKDILEFKENDENPTEMTASLTTTLTTGQLSQQLPFCPLYSADRTLYGLYCAAVSMNVVPEVQESASEDRKSRKSRRNRTVFTESQLMGLERRFDSQKYLSTPDRADLARALGLTQLQVKTWYQNRRMKWKKQVLMTGCPVPPTKPKGRPKKNSIPSFGQLFH